jgi:biotin transport system substrate-specific component
VTLITQTRPTLIETLWPTGASASRSALLVVLGSVFLAVCAQIYIPLEPVPITMQTFGVLVLGMAYGWRAWAWRASGSICWKARPACRFLPASWEACRFSSA